MKFYLGTHCTPWLTRTLAPLFISHRRLVGRNSTYPRAICEWALDSGGFSELGLFGAWETTPGDYVASVRRYVEEIGRMEWASIQDWMCEPVMLNKTGLSVAEHQARTVDSLLRLQDLAPEVHWTPVLQGWDPEDYFRHVDSYYSAGVDLHRFTPVGIGSVCRRQHTSEVEAVIRRLAGQGLRLHGFGFKLLGARRVGDALWSADSMAWSLQARWEAKPPECAWKPHKNCANCLRYALRWRHKVLEASEQCGL